MGIAARREKLKRSYTDSSSTCSICWRNSSSRTCGEIGSNSSLTRRRAAFPPFIARSVGRDGRKISKRPSLGDNATPERRNSLTLAKTTLSARVQWSRKALADHNHKVSPPARRVAFRSAESFLTAPAEVPVAVSGTTVAAMTESAGKPTRRGLPHGHLREAGTDKGAGNFDFRLVPLPWRDARKQGKLCLVARRRRILTGVLSPRTSQARGPREHRTVALSTSVRFQRNEAPPGDPRRPTSDPRPERTSHGHGRGTLLRSRCPYRVSIEPAEAA